MLLGTQKFIAWFGVELSNNGKSADSARLYTFIGCVLAAPIYTVFALTNFYAYGAVKMALVTTTAALVAMVALLLVRYSSKNSIPGHCFTSALSIQVFGEMLLNGGLQAPAAALSLLVIPAAMQFQLFAPWMSVGCYRLMNYRCPRSNLIECFRSLRE